MVGITRSKAFFLHAVKGQLSPRKRSGRMGKEEMNDESVGGERLIFFQDATSNLLIWDGTSWEFQPMK